jgi:hypothetical protein
MEKSEKLSAFVSQLNRLTKEGQIKWKSQRPPHSLVESRDSEGRITYFWGAKYMGKNIGVYEEKYRAYNEDTDSSYWESRPVLGFFGENWELEYEKLHIMGMWDLIDTIKYQLAEVEEFLDKILSDKS